MWSSAQGTRRSVLVALRLVGPAVSARAPAWTHSRRCPQSGPLSSRGARRVLVALQQCLREIALVEERTDLLSNRRAAFLTAPIRQAVPIVLSRGDEVPLRLILRSGTSFAAPKASFNAQRRETGRRQLWKGSSTTWDIESRQNREVG